ncbi:aspartyl protease [Ceratobasidium sp. AG-Ba]|nr:aspartyl protease [Ceratobasidium sp. AG-Ba]
MDFSALVANNFANWCKDQKFAAVTKESRGFVNNTIDGIWGLGYPKNSVIGSENLVQKAFKQKSIPSPEFSFRLSETGSELCLGGTNPDKYQGGFACAGVTEQIYWRINGTLARGPQQALSHNYTGSMIIDSGTTLMLGPPADVKSFYTGIDGAEPCSVSLCGSEDPTYWLMPCDKFPSIFFVLAKQFFQISPNDFNLGQVNATSTQCVGALVGFNATLAVKGFVMGDTLMKNTYTNFNMASNEVCFAHPK